MHSLCWHAANWLLVSASRPSEKCCFCVASNCHLGPHGWLWGGGGEACFPKRGVPEFLSLSHSARNQSLGWPLIFYSPPPWLPNRGHPVVHPFLEHSRRAPASGPLSVCSLWLPCAFRVTRGFFLTSYRSSSHGRPTCPPCSKQHKPFPVCLPCLVFLFSSYHHLTYCMCYSFIVRPSHTHPGM